MRTARLLEQVLVQSLDEPVILRSPPRATPLRAVVAISLLVAGSGQASARPVPVDFDGDGRSDYAVTRASDYEFVNLAESARRGATAPRPAGLQREMVARVTWLYLGSEGGGNTAFAHGIAATDFITPADFDGDGKVDPAVWRTGPAEVAAFYILESITGRVREEQFGQTGDDPLVVGDYDGDGKADPAVFRCPIEPGQCTFFFRGSFENADGRVTYLPFGFGTQTSLFPCPGDYDGDGKFDLCLQRGDPDRSGRGQFLLMNSSDLSLSYIGWGRASDRVVPGDYNGDGRDDFVVVRNTGSRLSWFGLYSDGTGDFQFELGLEGDLLAPGDYDGDGKIDPAVWRPGATAADAGLFITLESSTNETTFVRWGRSGDYPPAEVPVH